MTQFHRLAAALVCAAAVNAPMAQAQEVPQAPLQAPVAAPAADDASAHAPDADESDKTAELTAELFYELLVGEISASRGDARNGYALMLNAARRTGSARLYRRATEIALQSGSAESALIAVRAWQQAQPQARDANRYMLRILVALNRPAQTAAPLRQELAAGLERDRIGVMQALPALYANVSDKALAARVVERAIATATDDLGNPVTGPAAWTTIGRMRLAAKDTDGALDAARRALALNATDAGAILLVLQLMENDVPDAEPLLTKYLAGKPLPEVRMAYARVLLQARRLSEAQTQVETVTRERPDALQAWLALASLHLQAHRLDAAEAAMTQLTQRLDALPESEQRQHVMTQVYLMQAQIAEQRGDFAAADGWLARIDDDADALNVQNRRASLLARQGKVDEALALLRAAPAATPEDARLKLQFEAQLLREAGQYQKAYEAQSQAVALAPQDNDLIYDQAMLADKAGHTDEMERLLRGIITRQPDYYHALNALGYSMADRGVELQEARALIARALTYAPDDPFITDSLGWVEFRLGNPREALRLLEKAYQKQPDVEIAAHMGEVLWTLGERERALAIWREGQRSDKNNATLQDTLKRLGASL